MRGHTKGWKKKGWQALFFAAVCVCAVLCRTPERVQAAGATVTFGSNYYMATDNERFPVGVYIDADERIGAFRVEVSYDNRRLQYVGGGDFESDGVITLEGTGQRSQVKYMLQFQTLSGGTAKIAIQSASVSTQGEDAQELTVEELIETEVRIDGEDIVGEEEPETESELPESGYAADIPLIGETTVENETYGIVDLDAYLPAELDWDYQLVSGRFGEERVTWATNLDMTALFLYLLDHDGGLHLYAYSREHERLYPCNSLTSGGEKFYFMSPYVPQEWPDGLTLHTIQELSIVYVMDTNGQCGFCRIDSGNVLTPWEEAEGTEGMDRQTVLVLSVLAVTVAVAAIAVAVAVFLDRRSRRQEGTAGMTAEEIEELFLEDFSLDVSQEEILAWRQEAEERADKGEPVIAVKNVTMCFRVATQNVSGIKEYVISRIKGQISYRELWALKNISFCVYPGEVVGIIGTNGSGKSTLLKLISGALRPTAGSVEVDRGKVQLLTLGTGFDMELTAHENVYLNGAIIGYSREFLDEKYDEIVEFAELEGFMEEKVKNFSSGMVSRLGFAIATAGEAAEILILDEVLSVGDAFFQKKSLERIKQLIHSGSTVLMVSHSMGTILDNCTKVVWIEKGRLRMVGEAKEVCAAYQRQGKEAMQER